MKTIVGAGLAGLIAAHAWPRAAIVESAPAPVAMHKALLRFRSDAVAKLTGIEFRRVRVRKGIWSEGGFTTPNIRVANLYARKVLGSLGADRSIWNLDAAERYVAPETLYEQLIVAASDRIEWGRQFDFAAQRSEPIVSTAPVHATLDALGIKHSIDFRRAPITVQRFRVAGADLYQTIYFPDGDTPIYRASFTGETLIVELVPTPGIEVYDLTLLERAFGVDLSAAESLGSVKQTYGKIAAIDDATRKAMLLRLTDEHGIYSLGRFATWRNILLDDVVDDIAVIKRLAHSASRYALRLSTQ